MTADGPRAPQLVRLRSLPRLADAAVRATLAPPRATILWCGVLSALLTGVFTALMAIASSDLESTAGAFVFLGSIIVWMPVMFAGSVLVYALLAIHAAHRVLLGVELSVGGAFLYLLRPSVLFTVIFVVVAVLVGGLLLLIPGIVALTLLCAAVPVMVAERRYMFDAIGRSVALFSSTHGGTLLSTGMAKAFAILLTVIAMSTLLTLVFQVPMQVITQGLIFREALSGGEPTASTLAVTNWIALPFTLITSIVAIGVYAFGFHALALLYQDCVERSEAPALERAVASLSTPPPPVDAGRA